jgi:hypothetical protein
MAAGSPCGDFTDTKCTDPDTCDGAGSCQANDAADGATCGDEGTECVKPDTCLAGACQDNGFVAAGSLCGDLTDATCTDPDTCDGGGICQANHAADGTPCDDDGQFCTGAETCNRAGECVSAGDPCDDLGLVCDEPSMQCVEDDSACGDVDCSGAVGLADAGAVAELDVGLRACDAPGLECADQCDIAPPSGATPGDGACNIGDALRMAQCAEGLIACGFGCETLACDAPVAAVPPVASEPAAVSCEASGCAGPGALLEVEMRVNAGSAALGAYTFEFACDPAVLEILTVVGGRTPEFLMDPVAVVDGEGCHARFAAYQTASLTGPTETVSVAQLTLRVREAVMAKVATPLALEVDALFTAAGQPLSVEILDDEVIVGGCDGDGDCRDGNACDGQETCDLGSCQCRAGTPVTCSDGDVCNGVETCAAPSGGCAAGVPLTPCPEDTNECTVASCDPLTGCGQARVPDGLSCTPALGCQTGAACLAGVCIESSVCEAVAVATVQVVPIKPKLQRVKVEFHGEPKTKCGAQVFVTLPPAKAVKAAGATSAPATAGRCAKTIAKARKKAARQDTTEVAVTKKGETQIKSDQTSARLELRLNRIGQCLLADAAGRGERLIGRVQAEVTPKDGDTMLLEHLIEIVQNAS